MGKANFLNPSTCIDIGMFPIVAAQKHYGYIDIDGVCNVAVLQDISFCTKDNKVRQILEKPKNSEIVSSLTNLLALAFADEETFAEAFPDKAMRTPTVHGRILPGYSFITGSGWVTITPERATPQQQRQYVRHYLMTSAAEHIISILDPDSIDQIAIRQPRSLHAVQCLRQVATDICNNISHNQQRSTAYAS